MKNVLNMWLAFFTKMKFPQSRLKGNSINWLNYIAFFLRFDWDENTEGRGVTIENCDYRSDLCGSWEIHVSSKPQRDVAVYGGWTLGSKRATRGSVGSCEGTCDGKQGHTEKEADGAKRQMPFILLFFQWPRHLHWVDRVGVETEIFSGGHFTM